PAGLQPADRRAAVRGPWWCVRGGRGLLRGRQQYVLEAVTCRKTERRHRADSQRGGGLFIGTALTGNGPRFATLARRRARSDHRASGHDDRSSSCAWRHSCGPSGSSGCFRSLRGRRLATTGAVSKLEGGGGEVVA